MSSSASSAVYHTDTAIFPLAANLRLPIEAEPKPSMSGTQRDEPEWGSDDFVAVKSDDFLGDLPKRRDDQKQAIRDRIQAYRDGIADLKTEEKNVDNQLAKGNVLSSDEQQEFGQEKTDIQASRDVKQKRIDELSAKLQKLEQQESQTDAAVKNLPATPSSTGNFSALPEHLAKDKMRESEERYTQWVRATYPYVDSYRATILAQFETALSISKAAEYYRKWSDRYTLTNAWKFRSGFRFEKISDKRGGWTKSTLRCGCM